ncbi:PH domain-containing protein [Actinopolymorpha sp. NPDC004070]|uniref:PH domain-containing protein n=1 Tax=Actinopolymorpha sp. NPDC004070 TaxID=3154548 RepID=UPI0033AEB233
MTELGNPPSTAATATDTAGWRRLSPRMLAVHPVQELVRSFPALLGALVAGTSSGHGPLWGLVGLVLVIGLGTLRWFTTTYRISPAHVQVRRGLLRRRVLTVPRDRVRTVDVTANAMHRVVGLARVEIGTGRSDRRGENGLKLDALAGADARRLREELLHRLPPAAAPAAGPAPATAPAAGPAPATTPPPAPEDAPATTPRPRPAPAPVSTPEQETRLATLDPRWVRYGPFTLSGLLTIGVVLGFGSRAVSEAKIDLSKIGPVHRLLDQVRGAGWLVGAVEVVVLLLVVCVLASTLAYVLAFWNYRLTRHPGGTLHVNRGLITTRATSIEERRMRGVELSEPLSLRLAGGARCIAIATGLRVGRGAERGGSLLLPPAPRKVALRVAGDVFGGVEPYVTPLVPHGPQAVRRRFTRALGLTALLVLALAALHEVAGLPAWVWQAWLVLLPCAALVAADRARSLGHALRDGVLVCRFGSLVRRRNVLTCDGVLGWNLRQSFFQRRVGLTTLVATTAAGRQHYEIPDVDTAEAVRVADAAVPGLLTPFLVHAHSSERQERPERRAH